LRYYAPCTPVNGGCVIALNEMALTDIAAAARSRGNITVTLRGMSGSGTTFGAAAPRQLGMTATSLRGGIYFWNAIGGSLLRFDFGRSGAMREVFLRGDVFNCVGCHALSRDGSRIIVSRGIPGPGAAQILTVATRENVGAGFGSNFHTFS